MRHGGSITMSAHSTRAASAHELRKLSSGQASCVRSDRHMAAPTSRPNNWPQAAPLNTATTYCKGRHPPTTATKYREGVTFQEMQPTVRNGAPVRPNRMVSFLQGGTAAVRGSLNPPCPARWRAPPGLMARAAPCTCACLARWRPSPCSMRTENVSRPQRSGHRDMPAGAKPCECSKHAEHDTTTYG
jgi:hypothetical protein